MLTIRLQRRGRKNDPSFRVIVVDSKRAGKTGSYLEMLGSYDARTNRVELDAPRIKHWLSQGAKTSDTVHNLLISKQIIEGKKINVLPKKTPPKVEGEEPKTEVKEGSPDASVGAPTVDVGVAPTEPTQ
jgi:small subunit ribosomal protein S16